MILTFNQKRSSPLRVLCLGAHSDDIEIGCGGTILRLAESYSKLDCYWVVFSSGDERKREAVRSAGQFLRRVKRKKVVVEEFRTSFFPYSGVELKEFFEKLKDQFQPDLIFTHYRNDLHQDHRTICDLTWNTYRNHFILEYEIPKYDGDLGSPNFFVQLDEPLCRRKARLLMECFKTQRNKHWFTEEAFLSILRLRGIESCQPSKYAEGFHCRKIAF